jgi:hypothetical protein
MPAARSVTIFAMECLNCNRAFTLGNPASSSARSTAFLDHCVKNIFIRQDFGIV